ncbi:MAG: conjugal transfer protein TraB [Desulfobacterales bacterium]|nr:conjugal transfer protein TraB [Desulfobacterales bacterium]
MGSLDEQILRATKEIIVKFIEVGRLTPTGFEETFKNTYQTIKETVKDIQEAPAPQGKKK